MSFSNDFENDLLLLLFNNTNIANMGDATGVRGSTTAGSFYVALHTADPAETGKQNANEAAYTNYVRVAVARSGAGWTVSGNNVVNAATVSFPQCGATGATITHWSVGYESSGATKILFRGPLGSQPAELFTAATNDNITIPGHTLAVDDRIVFMPIPNDTFPTGITEGTIYWVKTSATDVITISTTQGGTVVDITAAGAGRAQKLESRAISTGITPTFAAGALSGYVD